MQSFDWKGQENTLRIILIIQQENSNGNFSLPADEGADSLLSSVWHALAISFIASFIYGRRMFDSSKSRKVLWTCQKY